MALVDDPEVWQALAMAVVARAMLDYASALVNIKKNPNNYQAQDTIRECEKFFRNDFEMYFDLDGERIIKLCKEYPEHGRLTTNLYDLGVTGRKRK